MITKLKSIFDNKSLALLGFGREGRSTYTLLRQVFPQKVLTIIDENEAIREDPTLKNDTNLLYVTGENCMQYIVNYDIAIKSPGIPSNTLPSALKQVIITSQTDIFLQCYGRQSIGITGTKGKSTTASLVYHILKNAGFNAMLVGNIGIPPFDCIADIKPESIVVLELSSHQLEYVSHSPHIAILLNIFQEHLDHYNSYLDYQMAKLNIGKYQGQSDYFIYNNDNEAVKSLIHTLNSTKHRELPFSPEPQSSAAIHMANNEIVLNLDGAVTKLYNTSLSQPLQGHHNLYNIMAAAAACYLSGVNTPSIDSGIRSFNGLEHRIEKVGEYDGIIWYNDSIATIPEATIEAVKTLQNVDTLILGGFDRGIEYDILYPFMNTSEISNIIFVGGAGERMLREFTAHGVKNITFYTAEDYVQVVTIAGKITAKGKICLLSPAAASYDMFKNFEERGNIYKKNVRNLSPSHD
jgi:UDP-N-acetylmuramoyl-L-alanine---L-glutamate ligase